MIGKAWRVLVGLGREVNRHGEATRANTGKGKATQAWEILRLRARGFNARDYYLLELHSQDPGGYVGTLRYAAMIRKLNPKQIGIVPFNKWIMSGFLRGAGLPVPEILGVFSPGWGWIDGGGSLRSEADLRGFLSSQHSDLVFKPLEGGKGRGVQVVERFDRDRDVVRLSSGREHPLPEWWTELAQEIEGYIIQKRIRACGPLHDVHPGSLNTVRVTTLLSDTGQIELELAVLRMGAGGAAVDNMSAGGIAAMIDPDSGTCGEAVSESDPSRFTHHPDTGVAILGLQVPFWKEALDTAIRAHSVIPFPRSLSWDIAITDEGPLIIEVNGHDPVAAFQRTGWRLMEGPLGRLSPRG